MSKSEGQLSNRALTIALVGVALVNAVLDHAPRATAQTPTAGISPSVTASITIDASKVEGRINPLLYGQFAEFMYENIKGGLHAELIRNRSFEEAPNNTGLSRYWERYPDDRNDDYGLSFHWDETVAYPNTKKADGVINGHALRVQTGPGVIPRHGVYQNRMPIRQGMEYRGYLWLKAEEFHGGVKIALEADVTGGEIYAEAEIDSIGGDWKKYDFTLKSKKSDPLARLAILFNGQGKLWVDQVSLMPGDAVDGVRTEVFEKVKALRPAFIRWPGGNVAQDYHWQWGIGPRDERVTWVNLSWKNEAEPSDFGTDEFIRFCRNAGAEPSITVNVEGRGATVEEAAAWVEYCNAPEGSRFGAMRARNGHREPYGVKYWEIGNEIWGNWVRGHSNAETYARNYNRYIAAMRAVDPSIKFIAVGDNDLKWNRTVLRLAGRDIDYLAIHHYYSRRETDGDLLNLMARPLHYERFYGEVERAIRELVPNRRIKLSINEWGLDFPESQQYSVLAALYGARLMNVFERQCDLVEMSAVSDLINGWPGGIIQASRHGLFVTPVYLVNRLYSSRLGAEKLASQIDSPRFDSTREGRGIPVLDAVVSRSADRKMVFIKAVNTDQTKPLRTRIIVKGAQISSSGVVESVTAESLTAANSFASPDAVSIMRSEIKAGSSFLIELPKHSASVITLYASK
jgi:alpha-L-arabinofuranosidase